MPRRARRAHGAAARVGAALHRQRARLRLEREQLEHLAERDRLHEAVEHDVPAQPGLERAEFAGERRHLRRGGEAGSPGPRRLGDLQTPPATS